MEDNFDKAQRAKALEAEQNKRQTPNVEEASAGQASPPSTSAKGGFDLKATIQKMQALARDGKDPSTVGAQAVGQMQAAGINTAPLMTAMAKAQETFKAKQQETQGKASEAPQQSSTQQQANTSQAEAKKEVSPESPQAAPSTAQATAKTAGSHIKEAAASVQNATAAASASITAGGPQLATAGPSPQRAAAQTQGSTSAHLSQAASHLGKAAKAAAQPALNKMSAAAKPTLDKLSNAKNAVAQKVVNGADKAKAFLKTREGKMKVATTAVTVGVGIAIGIAAAPAIAAAGTALGVAGTAAAFTAKAATVAVAAATIETAGKQVTHQMDARDYKKAGGPSNADLQKPQKPQLKKAFVESLKSKTLSVALGAGIGTAVVNADAISAGVKDIASKVADKIPGIHEVMAKVGNAIGGAAAHASEAVKATPEQGTPSPAQGQSQSPAAETPAVSNKVSVSVQQTHDGNFRDVFKTTVTTPDGSKITSNSVLKDIKVPESMTATDAKSAIERNQFVRAETEKFLNKEVKDWGKLDAEQKAAKMENVKAAIDNIAQAQGNIDALKEKFDLEKSKTTEAPAPQQQTAQVKPEAPAPQQQAAQTQEKSSSARPDLSARNDMKAIMEADKAARESISKQLQSGEMSREEATQRRAELKELRQNARIENMVRDQLQEMRGDKVPETPAPQQQTAQAKPEAPAPQQQETAKSGPVIEERSTQAVPQQDTAKSGPVIEERSTQAAPQQETAKASAPSTEQYSHLNAEQKSSQIEQAMKISGQGQDIKWDGKLTGAEAGKIEQSMGLEKGALSKDLDKAHATIMEKSKETVKGLQEHLNKNHGTDLPTNGNAGPKTLEALRQATGNPKLDWDGVKELSDKVNAGQDMASSSQTPPPQTAQQQETAKSGPVIEERSTQAVPPQTAQAKPEAAAPQQQTAQAKPEAAAPQQQTAQTQQPDLSARNDIKAIMEADKAARESISKQLQSGEMSREEATQRRAELKELRQNAKIDNMVRDQLQAMRGDKVPEAPAPQQQAAQAKPEAPAPQQQAAQAKPETAAPQQQTRVETAEPQQKTTQPTQNAQGQTEAPQQVAESSQSKPDLSARNDIKAIMEADKAARASVSQQLQSGEMSREEATRVRAELKELRQNAKIDNMVRDSMQAMAGDEKAPTQASAAEVKTKEELKKNQRLMSHLSKSEMRSGGTVSKGNLGNLSPSTAAGQAQGAKAVGRA